MSLVSVIIPTYNRARLICEAIESILIQTYPNYEIIVIDDGSTDNTAEVLEKYKTKICYIQQENKGPGDARNRGIVEAKGKYVAFLDSDDIWFDFKLELQVDILEKIPNIGFLSSDFCILKHGSDNIHYGLRTWHKKPKLWDEIYDRSIRYSSLNLPHITRSKDFDIFIGNLYYPLLSRLCILSSSAMVRRDCIRNDTKFAEGVFLYEDWEFFALLSKNYDAAFLNLETVYNRGHKDEVRLTQCSSTKKAENKLRLIERVWKTDESFSKKFGRKIAGIEGEQLLILVKENLLNYRPDVAKKFIRKWKQLRLSQGKLKAFFYKFFSYIPGGCKMLIIIRNFRRLFYL